MAGVIAAIHLLLSSAGAADGAKVLEDVEAARPDWLPDLDRCPADVVPPRAAKLEYDKERCAAALDQCLRNCRGGLAGDCYASALILQEVRKNPVSEALFLKACSLGIVSGCTNRAASMDGGHDDRCAIRTYEMGCDRDDPWACTMLGFHVVRGIGVTQDPERARQVLSKSCRFGETDPACGYAKGLLREIGD